FDNRSTLSGDLSANEPGKDACGSEDDGAARQTVGVDGAAEAGVEPGYLGIGDYHRQREQEAVHPGEADNGREDKHRIERVERTSRPPGQVHESRDEKDVDQSEGD